MLRSFLRTLKRIPAVLPALPLFFSYSLLRKARCDFCPSLSFWQPKPDPNLIQGRVQVLRYPANDPSEDSIIFGQLAAIPGYFVAVFDGHGGYEMAWYLERHFKADFEEALARNKALGLSEQEVINKSISETLARTDEKFLPVLRNLHQIGFNSANKVGSCALVVVVSNNKVYTGAVGDSQAALLTKKKPVEKTDESPSEEQPVETEDEYTVKFLNQPQNANLPFEQDQLRKEFQDKDIVTCFGKNSCYVKGLLQPTRTLGTIGMKYSDVRLNKLTPFSKPYIKSDPVFKTYDLSAQDNFLLIASDGLWKDISTSDVKSVFDLHGSRATEIGQALLTTLLQGVAKSMSLSQAYIRSLPAGARRKAHDDISLVLVELQKQTSDEDEQAEQQQKQIQQRQKQFNQRQLQAEHRHRR